MLFDWERFGWGTPARDLATTVPGLGTSADFALVAQRYLAISGKASASAEAVLARAIAAAKVWSAVEFLAATTEQSGERTQITEWLGQHLSAWLSAEV